jgi:hypothetical protein
LFIRLTHPRSASQQESRRRSGGCRDSSQPNLSGAVSGGPPFGNGTAAAVMEFVSVSASAAAGESWLHQRRLLECPGRCTWYQCSSSEAPLVLRIRSQASSTEQPDGILGRFSGGSNDGCVVVSNDDGVSTSSDGDASSCIFNKVLFPIWIQAQSSRFGSFVSG